MSNTTASIFAAFLLVTLWTPVAHAQAFGIKMGQKAASLAGAVEMKDARGRATRQYKLNSVPLPNSEFESYLVVATEKQGVCKVVALGETHVADKFGISVRRVFEALATTLTAKYGDAKEFDFLQSGSIWSEADDFAMSLKLEERTLAKFWTVGGDSIDSIALEAKAVSPSDTYLTLNYEFKNFADCVRENKRGDEDGL